MSLEKFYTPEEVAEKLSVRGNTVRKWLNDGILKGLKVGRVWRIKETELQEFIKRQEGNSNNE